MLYYQFDSATISINMKDGDDPDCEKDIQGMEELSLVSSESEQKYTEGKNHVAVLIYNQADQKSVLANATKCGVLPWSWYIRGKIALFDIGLYNLDTGTDLFTIYEHVSNCNYSWAIITAVFMMLPSLPMFITFMKSKIEEIKSGRLKVWKCCKVGEIGRLFWGLVYLHLLTIIYFGGGIVIASLYQIFFTIKCMFKMLWNPPGPDKRITTESQRNALRGKFMECQLEAAPQCIFQVNFSILNSICRESSEKSTRKKIYKQYVKRCLKSCKIIVLQLKESGWQIKKRCKSKLNSKKTLLYSIQTRLARGVFY